LAPRDRIAGVLLGAADYIERHGWCQGTSVIDDAVCAGRALMIAAGYDASTSERAGHRLMRFVGSTDGEVPGRWTTTVPDWNDKEGRTKEEVVEALRSAAFAAA
jgi:hypothetical protein